MLLLAELVFIGLKADRNVVAALLDENRRYWAALSAVQSDRLRQRDFRKKFLVAWLMLTLSGAMSPRHNVPWVFF